MAQDIETFHELHTIVTLKSPGQISQTDSNGHSKHQLPQHYTPCTTQASPPVMTGDEAASLSGCCSPPQASVACKVEESFEEDDSRRSTSPRLESSAVQHGCAAASQENMMVEHQVFEQDHYSDDLQLRIRNMWPSRPDNSNDYHQKNGFSQRRDSETTLGSRFHQPAYVSQNINDREKLGSLSRNWMADSHNLFQQPLAWNSLTHSTKHSLNQSLYYQDRLQVVDQGYSVNNSASYGPGMDALERALRPEHSNYSNLQPNTDSFQDYTGILDDVPITTLSPNTSLPCYETTAAMHQDRKDTLQFAEGDMEPEYKDDAWWQDSLLGDSPSSIEAPGSKVDEPYAQLIYRAFMSRTNKSMTLQEIYQWFRENTDKSKSEGKGWQNSIRHNLSMNGAFTKRNSKTPLSGNGDGSVSLDNAGADSRKSTEWFLEPAFYAGVESTTRYRKGNSGGRSRGIGSHSGRSRTGSDGHGNSGSGFSHARVSAGRKGGNVAAQNRKRLAERQQQARQLEMTRTHPRHLRQQQQRHGGYHSLPGVLYGGFDEAGYLPPYPTPHLTSPPFITGLGGVPTLPVQEQGRDRLTNMVYNRGNPDDLRGVADMKPSQRVGAQNDDDPVTPPDASLEVPRPAGFGSKQPEMLPEFLGSYNPLSSYQLGMSLGHHQQQPDGYPPVVTGIYESPAGGPQAPLFVGDDINLSPEDALLMNLSFAE